MCAPLHGTPRSWELAGLAHRKAAGCFCRNLLPPGVALHGGDTWLLNQLPLPGSSLRSGGGPCATVSKPGACTLWMLLQAGKLLLVPAMPLPEGWEPWLGQATLSSPVTQRPVSPHAAGSHSIAFPW